MYTDKNLVYDKTDSQLGFYHFMLTSKSAVLEAVEPLEIQLLFHSPKLPNHIEIWGNLRWRWHLKVFVTLFQPLYVTACSCDTTGFLPSICLCPVGNENRLLSFLWGQLLMLWSQRVGAFDHGHCLCCPYASSHWSLVYALCFVVDCRMKLGQSSTSVNLLLTDKNWLCRK